MHVVKNGYVAGAVLMVAFSKKLREHVEYEKFLCRMLVDDEKTREFEKNTGELKNQLYALRYNNESSKKLTIKGKTKNGNQS